MMAIDRRLRTWITLTQCLALLSLAGCSSWQTPPSSPPQTEKAAREDPGDVIRQDLLTLRAQLQGMLDAVEQRIVLQRRMGAEADPQDYEALSEQRLTLSVALAHVERTIEDHRSDREASLDLPRELRDLIAETADRIDLSRLRGEDDDQGDDDSRAFESAARSGERERQQALAQAFADEARRYEPEKHRAKGKEKVDKPRRVTTRSFEFEEDDIDADFIKPASPRPPSGSKTAPGGRHAARVSNKAGSVDLAPFINRRLPRMQACFPPDLLANGVQLMVRARLGDGLLRGPRVRATSPIPAGVKACLIGALQGIRVPSDGGSRVVSIPLWLGGVE